MSHLAPLQLDSSVGSVPLLSFNDLSAIVRLLRVQQPVAKHHLQRVMLNLCAHASSRDAILSMLLATLHQASSSHGSPGTGAAEVSPFH